MKGQPPRAVHIHLGKNPVKGIELIYADATLAQQHVELELRPQGASNLWAKETTYGHQREDLSEHVQTVVSSGGLLELVAGSA